MPKAPIFLSLILCIAVYAVQLAAPCGSCSSEYLSCAKDVCSSCCDNDNAPEEDCFCKAEEMPMGLQLDNNEGRSVVVKAEEQATSPVDWPVREASVVLELGAVEEDPPPNKHGIRANLQKFQL